MNNARWRDIAEYEGGEALFWMVDPVGAEYAVFGVIETRGRDDQARVWDDNDFGYGLAEHISCFMAITRPPRRVLHG